MPRESTLCTGDRKLEIVYFLISTLSIT